MEAKITFLASLDLPFFAIPDIQLQFRFTRMVPLHIINTNFLQQLQAG